jgi:hypothetical protein
VTAIDRPDWDTSALTVGTAFQLLVDGFTIGSGAHNASAVIYAGHFQSIMVELATISINTWNSILTWYEDPLGATAVWTEPQINKTQSGDNLATYTVKAPYFQVVSTNTSAGSVTATVIVNGLPGAADPGAVFAPQLLAEGGPISVGAGVTTPELVLIAVPGPALLWGQGAAAGDVIVQHWNGSAWMIVGQFTAVANVADTIPLILPSDDLRVQLTNTSAAPANFFYSLYHGG